MSRYVLDSYAILASYRREPGAPRVEQLLADSGNQHWMTVVNLGEVFYRIAKDEDMTAAGLALVWMNRYPLRYVDADWPLTYAAAQLKTQFALSYADCFAAALARQLNARIVTGDEEFRTLQDESVVDVEWIAAKPKRGRR